MPSHEVDVRQLPDEIRVKLAQLDLELSQGDLTEKGYESRRQLLLKPFLEQQQPANNVKAHTSTMSEANVRNFGAIEKRKHRRGARDQLRYHSEIRQEAVQQALSEWGHGGGTAAKKTISKGLFQPILRRHTSRVSCAAVAAAVAAHNGNVVGEEGEDETADSSSDDEDDKKKTMDSGTAGENNGNDGGEGMQRKVENGHEANGNCDGGRTAVGEGECIGQHGQAAATPPQKTTTIIAAGVEEAHSFSVAKSVATNCSSVVGGGQDESDKGGTESVRTTERKGDGRTNGSAGENRGPVMRQHQLAKNISSSANDHTAQHQLANRTSVLVLEDRPLPPLPPATDDEEEDESGGASSSNGAVYVNSTNDSGLGGSSNAPQDYANTNIPLQTTRVSRKIQQVLQSLQVG